MSRGQDLILLYLYMACTALALLLAGLTEYQGLKQQVSGANGFIWTMVLLVMGTILVPTTIATWIFWSGHNALYTLLGGAIWLGLSGYASVRLMMLGAKAR